MKKLLTLCLLILTFSSCQRNEIYKEYQQINQVWKVESFQNINLTNQELYLLDFSQCKISKKLARNESSGCLASVNNQEKGGLMMNFRVEPENKFEIIEFLNLTVSGDGISSNQPSEFEIKLNNQLKGEWSYNLEGERLILSSGNRSIYFTN
jgi:hypothetical protein